MKKIILWVGFVALVIILVVGGLNRTQSISGNEFENVNSGLVTGGAGAPSSGGVQHNNDVPNESSAVSRMSEGLVSVAGVVESTANNAINVRVSDGSMISIEGRALRYLDEKAFNIASGDQVSLTGFYEGDVFETAVILNEITGVSIRLRDADGRPLWGGGAR
ncbi:MAG: hypothetical protein JW704_13935 [Anaerolineaceae bacterium]|nr:hypothetical protein [Anaerolineaceae bacterium]MBN2676576.1 hypothetical protein [Anaerolineaceae bacterium]